MRKRDRRPRAAMPAPRADVVAASTRSSLARDLRALGLKAGDHVLIHAGLRSIGPIVGGPDALIDAFLDVLGPDGTLLAYCDWQMAEEAGDDPALRDEVPAFDAARSRAIRDHGAFPEMVRTTPGARRSGNPGASVAALGRRAEWFTADHPLDYGYGPDSPFGRLVAAGGKTMLLGAPRDTLTLLHHAEHLADIPNKRVLRFEVPLMLDGAKTWRWCEEFDTRVPVVAGLAEDYFVTVVDSFIRAGHGATGRVGSADCALMDAKRIVRYAVDWLEQRCG